LIFEVDNHHFHSKQFVRFARMFHAKTQRAKAQREIREGTLIEQIDYDYYDVFVNLNKS